MKLISSRYASSSELKHAFSAEEACHVVKQHLNNGQSIEGMQELRSFLMLNFDAQVLAQVESGEWLLIKPDAYYFDWAVFASAARDQLAMALMQHPIIEPRPATQVLQVMESGTLEWLVDRRYTAIINGASEQRRIDELGVTHLPASAKGADVVIKVK